MQQGLSESLGRTRHMKDIHRRKVAEDLDIQRN
jgi:hypothetical protein